MDIMPEIVKKILRYGALAEDGVILCENDKPELDLEALDAVGAEVKKRYKYGKTYIHAVGRK